MRTFFVFVGAVIGGALLGCSFTAAGNFTECENDAECGNAGACAQGYCLPLPEGCRREAPGGDVNPFTEGDRIPLAALLPLTNTAGGADNSEVQGLNAIKLAISEANDNKGLANRHFGLFVCDTSRSDDALSTQLTWMIDNLDVPAVITSGSSQTQEAAKNAARLRTGALVVSATATSPSLVSTFTVEGNVWRISPPDTLQAQVMLALVRADFPDAGVTRVNVVFENTDYGAGLGENLASLLDGAGYQATRRSYRVGVANDYTNVVTGLVNDTPRATVLVGFPPDLRELVGRAATANFPAPDAGHRWYLSDAAKDPEVLTAMTLPTLTGAIGTAPSQGAGGAFLSFRDSFRGRYGTDPLRLSYTSHSYDAAWLLMLSAAWASQSGGAITGPRMGEGMQKLQVMQPAIPLRADKWIEASNILSLGNAINVEGTSGPLDFDLDAGAASSPYEIWQVAADAGIDVLRLTNP